MTADDLLAVARGQLGTPVGAPGVPYATTFSCAKFTSWVYEQIGLGQYANESPAVQMGIFDQEGRVGPTPHPGDQVFVDLTGQGQQAFHTGFVDTVNADGSVKTIEFNAPDGGPNTVKYHTREPVGDGFTLGFGHPPYTAEPAASPVPAPTTGEAMRLYLGVGHGLEPNGVFDPGAHNDVDGTDEYDINFAVTNACHLALVRSGVSHYTETSAGRGHDVDYRGAVDTINAGGYDLAVELHYDSFTAPDDEFGIYASDAGKRLADLIQARMVSVGQPTKPSYKDVRGLYFIEGTDCPALIVECGATHHREPEVTQLAGEIIAAAICDWYGVAYVPATSSAPPASPVVPATPIVTHFPEDHMKHIAIRVQGNGPHGPVGLDDKGHGSTLLDVPMPVVNAYPNTAGYADVPAFVGAQDDGGRARIEWKGPPNFPPFDAHILVPE